MTQTTPAPPDLAQRLSGELERLSLHYQNLMAECDEKDAEIERLRADVVAWGRIWNDVRMMEGRAEHLRNGTAILSSDEPADA